MDKKEKYKMVGYALAGIAGIFMLATVADHFTDGCGPMDRIWNSECSSFKGPSAER